MSILLRLHPLLRQHEWLQGTVDDEVALRYHGATAGIDCLQWDSRIDAPLGLGKGRRSDLNFARRSLTVQRLDGGTVECASALEQFRNIYGQTMERLGASSFYSFKKEYYSLLSNGLGSKMCLINALSGGAVVGSAMFFAGGKFAHYHLSGSTKEGRQFKAGTFLVVEGVRWGRERGCASMHLGGGTHADDSLLRFKQSFGGQIYEYHFLTAITDYVRYAALTNARQGNSSLPPPRVDYFPRYRA